MPNVKERLIAALEDLGAANKPFTMRQVRELLGIRPRTQQDYTLWNLWRALQEAGVVEEVQLDAPRQRKRNRVYRVAQPRRLAAFRPASLVRRSRRKTTMAAIKSLEKRVAALERLCIRLSALLRECESSERKP